MADQTDWMTSEEVAARLGVTRATVGRLVKRKELPALQVGRVYRFDPEVVEGFVNANTTTSATEWSQRGAAVWIRNTPARYPELFRRLAELRERNPEAAEIMLSELLTKAEAAEFERLVGESDKPHPGAIAEALEAVLGES